MEPTAWTTAAQNVGISTVIVIGIGFIIWRLIVPAIIRQYEQAQAQQKALLESYQSQQKIQQEYYVAEIKSLREEARNDKQMMFEAFRQNIESNTQLKGALEGVTDQLTTLANEVNTVKTDMTKVYLILGNDKKLIETRGGE